MPRIYQNLWFDTEAKEAAEFYCSVFPNSRITTVANYTAAGPGPEGSVMYVEFELDGQLFGAINGGPQFKFNESLSLVVDCKDQAEIDHYWAALTEGGQEDMCGWLKDRYGLSWQVVPTKEMNDVMSGDPARVERAMRAMFTMKKLDIAALRAAADGAAVGA